MSQPLPLLPSPPGAAQQLGAPPLPCILNLDLDDIQSLVAEYREKPFRARQLYSALNARLVGSWDEMTDLPGRLRNALSERFRLQSGELVIQALSKDGTRKRLVRLAEGQEIETVAIPAISPEGVKRLSVCVSTQAGCAMACTFCATGRMGLARNLTVGEIVDQVYGFGREDAAARPTHVVFMGMGEPLANYAATVGAIRRLSDPAGLNLSQRRITVSTSGLVPQIRRLAEEKLEVTLAISLHAPTDELRSELMPINQRFPLKPLMAAVNEYAELSGRRISFEYVLLHGVNDLPEHADQLARLIPRRLTHVNLIPYNATDAEYQSTPPGAARAFRDRLAEHGVSATIRASRGRDIAAACGQLKAENRKRATAE